VLLVSNGEADAAYLGVEGVEAARDHHARVREELPVRGLALSKSDPAIPTVYVDAEA
jgi:nicotinate phosphoribosyltransferase